MYWLLYPFFVLGSVSITLLAFLLVNWWAPLLTNSEGNLPKYLYWFQTFDNTLDAGWKIQGNYGTYLKDGIAPTGFTLFRYRVMWLYRNSCYGFDMYPFGIAFDKTKWTVRKFVSNPSDPYSQSIFFATGQGAFNFEYAYKWIHIKLGWKAWNYFDPTTGTWSTNPGWDRFNRLPLCFTPV